MVLQPPSTDLPNLAALWRRTITILLLCFVIAVTVYALIGLAPPFEWVTLREALFLAAVNLMGMSAYFRWLTPQRGCVSVAVTSGIALFAAAIALFSARVVTPSGWVYEFELVGVATLLVLIVAAWIWYDFFVLHAYPERLNSLSDLLSLLEDDIENETENDR